MEGALTRAAHRRCRVYRWGLAALAAEIAETQPRCAVRLVTSGPVGAGLSGPGRDHVRRVLTARGVGLDEDHHVAGPGEVDADVRSTVRALALAVRHPGAAGRIVGAS